MRSVDDWWMLPDEVYLSGCVERSMQNLSQFWQISLYSWKEGVAMLTWLGVPLSCCVIRKSWSILQSEWAHSYLFKLILSAYLICKYFVLVSWCLQSIIGKAVYIHSWRADSYCMHWVDYGNGQTRWHSKRMLSWWCVVHCMTLQLWHAAVMWSNGSQHFWRKVFP